MASTTTTANLGSTRVHKATLTQRGVLPEIDDNNVDTSQPRFYMYFNFHRDGVLMFTGDNIEAEYPFRDRRRTTLEIPRCVLDDPILCSRYLWHALPWVNNILDAPVVRLLVGKMGSYAFRAARSGNFSGFQLVSTLKVLVSETVVVEESECEGVSESVLEKLAAESFYAGNGETNEHDNCVICLDEFSGETALTRMPCSHVFHQSCLFRWLRNSNSCPLCREKVDQD
ncbi:hypothetical protein K2173_014550 [Erythroxylum novogranatense]|uniref:RING-type domain-containing protein n=1 Tax=Erythroxylum novogranatense TaxID=1862640 RepID=A0AAV8S775_9ROSI|nr:hypothetical protein K2173_014550 [Erythroxylum novogranatense]